MINEVRNAVMAVINKNNYGYISPSDFNLFAEKLSMTSTIPLVMFAYPVPDLRITSALLFSR